MKVVSRSEGETSIEICFGRYSGACCELLLRAGHTVHAVYEACGFGFGLYRQLLAAGAHCYVIAPRKLDEQCNKEIFHNSLDTLHRG
jgi:transposase